VKAEYVAPGDAVCVNLVRYALKVFISLSELSVCFFMPAFVASNSVRYVTRLFIIMSCKPHNELELKFFIRVKKISTPSEIHLMLRTIVEKFVMENEYDFRTYGPIKLHE